MAKKDFFEVVRKRRSCRSFQSKPVPKNVIQKMLDAARMAPSALNKQPWEFIVVFEPEKKSFLREVYDEASRELHFYKQKTGFIEDGTPILVLSNTEEGGVMHLQGVCAAIENLLLAATALGLAAVWTARALIREGDVERIRGAFRIPERFDVVAMVVVGYPAEEPPPEKGRRSLIEVINYNQFGEKKPPK